MYTLETLLVNTHTKTYKNNLTPTHNQNHNNALKHRFADVFAKKSRKQPIYTHTRPHTHKHTQNKTKIN